MIRLANYARVSNPFRTYPGAATHRSWKSTLHHSAYRTSPLLSKFPVELAYIKSCKCWKLQRHINFDPSNQHRAPFQRSHALIGDESDYLSWAECDLGEVIIAADGLIHPGNTLARPFHVGSVTFFRQDSYLEEYIHDLTHSFGFPESYLAPEQYHIWAFPEGTPLPEGLYLRAGPASLKGEPGVLESYTLEISSAMTLQALNAALDGMLADYGKAATVCQRYFDRYRRK